jgi:hypothetical protein
MPDLVPKFGTATALTTTGLATLANGSSATSNAIDLTTTKGFDVAVTLSATTGASATSGSLIRAYAKFSLDGTTYSTDESDYAMGTITLPGAAAQTLVKLFSAGAAFPGGIIPAFLKVRIRQDTGAAFTAGTLTTQIISGQSV